MNYALRFAISGFFLNTFDQQITEITDSIVSIGKLLFLHLKLSKNEWLKCVSFDPLYIINALLALTFGFSHEAK